MLDDLILHDLKNPLSGITGSIGLFLDGTLGPISEEQQKYLINIDFSARKLALLLMELSSINNAEQGELIINKTSFPAREFEKELVWIRQLAGKEDKTIAVAIDNNLTVRADKELTLMAIEDLLLNAVKQVDRGGQVSFNIKKEKDGALFEITTAGDGIPQAYASKVFDKDFRAEHPELKLKTSAGLGLYFCKLALGAQGGRIGVEGARFYYSLPAGRQGLPQ
ncbi:MAG: ATP-binding protein [Candidatus Margulisiibacteriota bacterium]